MQRSIVPAPASVSAVEGGSFVLTDATRIVAAPGEPARIGGYLADLLRPSTGYPIELGATAGIVPGDTISLELVDDDLGDEGYRLIVAADAITVRGARPAGLFYGVQTLRQLMPARVEARTRQDGPWPIPAGTIVDTPRYGWRGAGLDVARHFFPVADVKRYLDAIALYKLNVLHLHLTDDQGWRIAIRSWPNLTSYGAGTEVGDGPGGYYTQDEYAELVEYAAARFITVVPEIDVPGHTNAALASYPELNRDGQTRDRYTGIDVGFSSLCVDLELTYRFLDDVIGEVAALTPGPYLHIGGDEVQTLPAEEYVAFIERVEKLVAKHGKRTVGWQEIAPVPLPAGTIAQYWDINAAPEPVADAVRRGAKVLLSPASRAYLDMKYDAGTELGLDWAGVVEVRDAYDWEPAELLDGVGEDALVGIEAPIWTETLATMADVEYMAFPRLPAIAEVAWSPRHARDWDAFAHRLASHAPRWTTLGIRYHRSPQLSWE